MKNKFNIIEFKNFVKQHLNDKEHRKIDELINAISQFDIPVHQFLRIKSNSFRSRVSKCFILPNKPIRVSVNIWLLHKFGFKKCNDCKDILPLSAYNTCNKSWDKIRVECRECGKLYYILNKQEILEKQKLHYINNKEYYIIKDNKRRAIKHNATIYLPALFQEDIKTIYNNRKKGEHIDHIIPLSKGGLHVPWNLQIVSSNYNLKKGYSISIEYIYILLDNLDKYGLPYRLKFILSNTATDDIKNMIINTIKEEESNK